jgi:hypothetical protein
MCGILVFWYSGLAPRKTRFGGAGPVCIWHVARGGLDFWGKNAGTAGDRPQVRAKRDPTQSPARSQTAIAHQTATHVNWRSDGSGPSGAPAPRRVGGPRRGQGRRGRNDHKSRNGNDLEAIRTAVGRPLRRSGLAGHPARRTARIRPPSSWRSDALHAGQVGHLQTENSPEGRSCETKPIGGWYARVPGRISSGLGRREAFRGWACPGGSRER